MGIEDQVRERLRALTLRVVAGAHDFPAADAAARRIVQTARPVGNAVQAPPAAARPAAIPAGSPAPRRLPGARATGPSASP
jgi:hypothetical protein